MKPDKTAETESTQLETEVESASRAPAARFGLPALTLLFHPDATRTGERITLPDLTSRGTVELSRLTPEFSAPGKTRKRPLADRRLSRRPLRLQPGRATGAVLLDPGSTPTSVYLGEELLRDAIELTHDEIEHGVILRLANRVVLLLHFVDPLAQRDLPDYGLIGASDALTQVRQDIRQVADLDVPVLVRGETGTGKELVAQAIHRASPRVDRPYVTVSMAAIPPTLAAAELFGAVKGAFTGADRHRQGYFRRAAGGTLFLDEIGETPEELQVLLLRCLESSEIQPVGADRTEKVDVRLITATDLDLEEAVAARRFRAPLLHRLNGYEITVPPLRQRRDDFGRLFFHFLRRELDAIGQAARLDLPQSGQKPWMSAALCARLAAFDWPGNVRQLRNVARQLAIASRESDVVQLRPSVERLLADDATDEPSSSASDPPSSAGDASATATRRRPSEISEPELLHALRSHRWQVQGAAGELAISRAALYKLMERSPKVRKADDLSREEIETSRERCAGDPTAMVEALEVSWPALRRRMKRLGLD